MHERSPEGTISIEESLKDLFKLSEREKRREGKEGKEKKKPLHYSKTFAHDR